MDALTQMKIAGCPAAGLIHVGANSGQERYEYQAAGVQPVIYVEPINAVFARLQQHIAGMNGHVAVQALCSFEEGQKVRLNVSSNDGESSSMFDLGAHAKFFPAITYTGYQDLISTTVDALLAASGERPNLIVIDTQGADLKVLQGAVRSLEHFFSGVFVEVCEKPLYEGGCTFDQVTAYLSAFGFRLRWLKINGWGHGNAFYFKS